MSNIDRRQTDSLRIHAVAAAASYTGFQRKLPLKVCLCNGFRVRLAAETTTTAVLYLGPEGFFPEVTHAVVPLRAPFQLCN